jgi:hypothetical protein
VQVKDWSRVATLNKDGDVKELIKIRAIAIQDNLYFLYFRADPKSSQPHGYRRGVHVDFRSINGAGRKRAKLEVTPSWLPDIGLTIHDGNFIRGSGSANLCGSGYLVVRVQRERAWGWESVAPWARASPARR